MIAQDQLMTSLLAGMRQRDEGDPTLRSMASRIQGLEDCAFLEGGRNMPLAAILARQVHQLTGGEDKTAEDLSHSLVVLLGVRGVEPKSVTLLPLSEKALEALRDLDVVLDAETFFYQEALRAQVRSLSVQTDNPEAVFEAWSLGKSSWATTGVLNIRSVWAKDENGEALPNLAYEPYQVARLAQSRFRPMFLSDVMEIGCERFTLQMITLAPENDERPAHPLWNQALELGFTTSEKTVLALVFNPDLSLMASLLGGPGANNVHGQNLGAVIQAANTGYSAWSQDVASQMVDEWGREHASLKSLESLNGAVRMVCDGLPVLIEGRATTSDQDSEIQQTFGHSVAQWIGGLFTTKREYGEGLVADIISKRKARERNETDERGQYLPDLSLEVRSDDKSMRLAIVELDANGAVAHERVFG